MDFLLSNKSINDSATRSPSNDALAEWDIIKKVFLGVLLFGFSLATAVGNAMVLHAVRTEKRLQTVCNMFIVSLASADITVGTFVMPISAVYVLTEDWIFGRHLCKIWLAVDYTASTASILNLLILSLDRYWSVSNPLLYLPKRTKTRARLMIFLVWITSALWLIPIFSWHRLVNEGVHTIPENECDPEYKENFPLKIVTGIFNFFIPLFVMYFLYGRIFLAIRKRSDLEKFQSMRRKGGCPGGGSGNGTGSGSGSGKRSPAGCGEQFTSKNRAANGACSSSSPRRSPVDTQDLTTTAIYCYGSSNTDPTAAAAATADSAALEPLLPSSCEAEAGAAAERSACANAEYVYDELIIDRSTERVQLLLLRQTRSQTEPAAQSAASPSTVQRRIRYATDAVNNGRDAAESRQQQRQLLDQKNDKAKSPKSRFKRSNSLKKEIKAAKQLGVIMGAFTACFMPYFVIFVVVAFCADCVSGDLMLAFTWVGYANSALNPILYPLCNHAFRLKFRDMLSCLRRTD